MDLNLKRKFKYFKTISGVILLLNSFCLFSQEKSEIRYRTSFGNCPSRTAGILTLKLMKAFEKESSMIDLKREIIKEKIRENHFISEYKISFDPWDNYLKFNFECPKPLMKVQIYKENGLENYEAILVEDGELYDPTYEVILRSENKLTETLPHLALPVTKIGNDLRKKLSKVVKDLQIDFRRKISEAIINDNNEMTLILSLSGHPSSVFLGPNDWDEKIEKLQKIVNYMELKKKVPAVINMANAKKVVVKFKDKF